MRLYYRYEGDSAQENVGGTSEGWYTAASAAADQYSRPEKDESRWYTGESSKDASERSEGPETPGKALKPVPL